MADAEQTLMRMAIDEGVCSEVCTVWGRDERVYRVQLSRGSPQDLDDRPIQRRLRLVKCFGRFF